MKDAEDTVELELDAAEFEEMHGIPVDEIDSEEREAYTELNAMWSSDELGPALKQMKHYKAAGEDGIVAEYMKLGGKEVFDCILLLLNAVWRLECCPVRWTRAMAWPIYKAGARTDPSNYRLITLLSVVCKVFERMITNRITALIRVSLKFNRPLITYTQVGFQFARSTLDAVYALILAISIRRLYGMPTYLAFIDVKKAFPSAFKAGILVKLYRLGITGKCWRMLRSMYSTVHSRILTGQESSFSEEELEALYYKIETGLREGSILSPVLYLLFINGFIEELHKRNLGVTVLSSRTGNEDVDRRVDVL